MEETWQDWLNSFDQEDNYKAAAAAVSDLGRLSGRARGLLIPILAEAFLMHRRNRTRAVERMVPVASVFSGDTTIERRTNRLVHSFALGDGRRVSWADATVEDHAARIVYLQKHIDGMLDTIAEHEKAIAIIEEYGVSCLGEIPT